MMRPQLIWLHRSEKQGNSYAALTIGKAYVMGEGVTKSRSSAETWYRKAANEGNPQAMYNLAQLYSSDDNKDRKEEAIQLFKKAAAARFPVAMRRVGNCYANGTGVPKDPAEAERWYGQAARAGDGYSAGVLFAKKSKPSSSLTPTRTRGRSLEGDRAG